MPGIERVVVKRSITALRGREPASGGGLRADPRGARAAAGTAGRSGAAGVRPAGDAGHDVPDRRHGRDGDLASAASSAPRPHDRASRTAIRCGLYRTLRHGRGADPQHRRGRSERARRARRTGAAGAIGAAIADRLADDGLPVAPGRRRRRRRDVPLRRAPRGRGASACASGRRAGSARRGCWSTSPACSSSTTSPTHVEQFDLIVDTNLKGTFLTCKAFLPAMIAAGLRLHRQHRVHRRASAAVTGGRCTTPQRAAWCCSPASLALDHGAGRGAHELRLPGPDRHADGRLDPARPVRARRLRGLGPRPPDRHAAGRRRRRRRSSPRTTPPTCTAP